MGAIEIILGAGLAGSFVTLGIYMNKVAALEKEVKEIKDENEKQRDVIIDIRVGQGAIMETLGYLKQSIDELKVMSEKGICHG